MTLTDKIIKACDCPKGMTISEIAKDIGCKSNTVHTIALLLTKQDRLFQAGVRRHFHYFKSSTDAAAWDLVAEAEYLRVSAESREKARQARNEARRKGNPAGRPRKATEEKASRAIAHPVKVKPKQARSTGEAMVTQAKTEIWPKDVKVTVVPTPPSRFAFIPPKGWKGQITCDWRDRRMEELCQKARQSEPGNRP